MAKYSNLNRVVNVKDHFKNVVHSKLLTPKGNENFLMKICFVLFCLFLIACSKDNEYNENVIVGKWGLISTGYYDMDNNVVINSVDNSQSYVEFLPNGKMKRPYLSMEETIELEFPYRIDEQFLYGNYTDAGNAFIYKYKVDEKKLTLEYVQGNIEDIYPQIVICIYEQLEK